MKDLLTDVFLQLSVGCGKGYVYTEGKDFCTVCPQGTYQPEEESDRCIPCPNNGTTKSDGADSPALCLGLMNYLVFYSINLSYTVIFGHVSV